MPMYAFIPVMLLPLILAIGMLLLRRRALAEDETISPVSRQHFELLQGGELNPQLVEAAKRRFQILLDRGDVAAVEARLTPGELYVVGVRALAELGTDAAANILERQLGRKLSNDQIEQTWYRIDLASGLRQLNRAESLPRLLGCADTSAIAPLGNVFAAETLCFEGFEDYLRQPRSKLGRAALQVTRRVFEGFRFFLQPQQIVTESRMGEMVESIWDRRPRPAQAEVVRVLHETCRYLHRVPAALTMLEDEPAEREAYEWQVARMQALESQIDAELKTAAAELLEQLPRATQPEQREILLALTDLRAETAGTIVPLLQRRELPDIDLALGALRWSRDLTAGLWMRGYARENVDLESRARPGRVWLPRRDHVTIPYVALLRALRGQMASDTEDLLVMAARDRDPEYRLAAVSSLGWWEPANSEVIRRLEESRRDPHADVRRAARAALARLGERSALQWFRQALLSDNLAQRHEAIHFVATEGLTLLWPDLDRLMESDNAGIAHRAREALMILSEDMSTSS